jgi:hypothetical protein
MTNTSTTVGWSVRVGPLPKGITIVAQPDSTRMTVDGRATPPVFVVLLAIPAATVTTVSIQLSGLVLTR